MIDEVLEQVQEDMDKAIEALRNDLASIRTGRASTSLVDKLTIEIYGSPMTLQQLAVISVPEPQMIIVRPFDPSTIKDIERGILQSNLGITPNNDGKLIRLVIPPLTEERRKDLAKQVHSRVEEGKVSVRNHRRDGLELLRELEKDKEISEDDFYRGRDELQKLTDEFVEKSDEIGKAKEEEIMSI
jgi:ribosome recycling factor